MVSGGMDRRDFLRLSAALTAARAARVAPAGAQDARVPVVIIGAGLAGLRAADLLRTAGRTVVVLEARSVPGGRVQTVRSPFGAGLYAEAGPIRISGSHQTVIALVRQHGLNLVPFSSSNGAEVVSMGGVSVRTDQLRRRRLPVRLRANEQGVSQGELLERYVGTIPDDLADLSPSRASYARWEVYDRVTWPAWLASRGASEGAVSLMTVGGASTALSALYVLRQYALLRGRNQYFKIEGGMDLLPRAMAETLGGIVRYNAPVVAIDQTGADVRVDYLDRGERASLSAARVIVTTPFSTLRDIVVRPALSDEKRRAISDIPYFPGARFLLETRSRFWHRAGLSGYARTDAPAEVWDATYDQPAAAGILGMTTGGTAAGSALNDLSEEAVVAFGARLVAAPFPAIRTELVRTVVRRWGLEPWSKGAFAVFHPGQMTSMMPAAASPEGRVHFAGEHTDSWMGWMEGALRSGERAAREVLR